MFERHEKLDRYLDSIELCTTDTVAGKSTPVRLSLYRYVPPERHSSGPRKPLLLLHGASANHRTFTVLDGGLAAWLSQHGFDPWLLDWRGSGLVGDDPKNRDTLAAHGQIYNFNRAAQHDIRLALDHIARTRGSTRISVLGFCMGSAILAEAIALSHITSREIDRIVLMALGLVYQSPIDGRLKSEDRALERVRHATGDTTLLCVDPRGGTAVRKKVWQPWDGELAQIYDAWPKGLKAHGDDTLKPKEVNAPGLDRASRNQVDHLCNHLSFMYGMPFNHAQLVEEIHGTDTHAGLLYDLFGAIPLHMLMHGAQNLREGQATFYRHDPVDASSSPASLVSRTSSASDGDRDDGRFLSDAARNAFLALERVTLMTGALNRLWHRDSIDRMHDWLRRGPPTQSGNIQKHVFPGYAHQDLLWGKDSAIEVFPRIKEALSGP
jgi:cholesterol oxidase